MRKRILTAEDLEFYVEEGELIIDRPHGQGDLPTGSLGVIKLLLENSELCKQGCEARFVCTDDRIRRRFKLLKMPLAKDHRLNVRDRLAAVETARSLVAKALQLHQRDTKRLEASPATEETPKHQHDRKRENIRTPAALRAA